MVDDMHPIEAKLIEILKDGRDWQLEDLGGIEQLAPAARSLGTTPIMPELFHPLVLGWGRAQASDRELHKGVLHDLLEVATTDFVLLEAVDILGQHRPLPDEGDECCFMLFLSKAATGDHSLSGLARSAALDGAFRWASDNRRWQLRLLDFFLGLAPNDDTEFLRRAAKIVGVAYSHWRDKELVEVLHKLAQLDAVRPEATFELGMAALSEAMDREDRNSATTAFRMARDWLDESNRASERSPETSLYLDGLDLLLSFHNGAASASIASASACVQRHAFELHAWSGGSGPPWLGSRQTEAACWSVLARAIAGLAVSLDEPSWWEPATVIEEGLLSVYNAGRSILRRDQHGGVESMVRPRIRTSVARQAGQVHQVRMWLQHNTTHEWATEAQDLIAQIDNFIEQSGSPNNPPEAASERTSLAAIIARSNIPEEKKKILSGVVENAMSLQLANLTGSEIEVIERCYQEARGHIDYNTNANGTCLFDTVLLWMVRFIFNRLELTKGDDPTGAYLFEREDGSLPHEDELQQDFFRWVATYAAGSDLEPTNIASGRADIRLQSGPERLVVEVKREEKDCSFDALFKSYAAQTTDYQNVSIRLGVLLVLDLATPNREGTPHLTSLFEMRRVYRSGESQSRMVLAVKVPGRRKRPSDLTKLAKTNRP
ncbi:hypothetical protein ABWH88_04145 [Marinobacter adhaerens]|jgi:hypothetical protein|uniref:Protein NO VEIN C-terminal domain-containing protein n=1 Tax=Marinobacter adhaerens TaxID=1033846 RepID=A0ABX8IP88_9GAMM|nr:hypothetical protein [Marinobacter adhaerens]MBW4980464.1 hypothetical protein [Marinobacter adhaerens]QWV14910.1 hypothetical protein KQ249_10120 [Marinobacter adhaerens]